MGGWRWLPAVVAVLILGTVGGVSAQQWERVEAPSQRQDSIGLQNPAGTKVFTACGERVRAADSEARTIVGRIDDLWGLQVRVFDSLDDPAPHAGPGGCVFFDARYMNALMRRLMIADPGARKPMMYAIMAHEVGHEAHHDLSPQRAEVATETKELEADRFAGYTLERLGLNLKEITPYYSLAGDEFAAVRPRAGSRHGFSNQRVDALKRGWDLARWGLPENYHSGLGNDLKP